MADIMELMDIALSRFLGKGYAGNYLIHDLFN